jgi:hypothetical protein
MSDTPWLLDEVLADQTTVFHPRYPPCSVLEPLFESSVYVAPLFEHPVHVIVNE